jgi:Sortase domain
VLGVGAGIHGLDRPPAVTAPDLGALPTPAPVPTTPKAVPTTDPTIAPARTVVVSPGAPSALALPAQKVTAPVVPVGVRADGELEIPDSPATVGWWVGSAPAGSPPARSTVLAGHVDSARTGVGAFAALRDVALGSPVVLTDTFGQQHAYRVTARRTYPKYALPRSVFSAAPLVLLTCGGPFDRAAGRYRDNIVVYAVPS